MVSSGADRLWLNQRHFFVRNRTIEKELYSPQSSKFAEAKTLFVNPKIYTTMMRHHTHVLLSEITRDSIKHASKSSPEKQKCLS